MKKNAAKELKNSFKKKQFKKSALKFTFNKTSGNMVIFLERFVDVAVEKTS